MNRIISRVLTHPIQGTSPRILVLEDEILLAGMSVDTNTRTIYRDVPGLARRYQAFKGRHPLPNKQDPWAFAAVSQGFDESSGNFTYLIGDVVTSFEDLPEGLLAFRIPSGTYAVFPIRPRSKIGWARAITDAKRYIYGSWLESSGYEPGGKIDDFEYHDQRSTSRRDPVIDLYIHIQPRQG